MEKKLKDFFEMREATNQRLKGDAGGLSDGQSESPAERKAMDKDYRSLMGVYDNTKNPNGPEFMIYSHLVLGYDYKPKIAANTLIRNNPDIKSIKAGSGGHYIAKMFYHDDDPVTFSGNMSGGNW